VRKRSALTYKMATEPEEIEQVHRLNYETFVEEIPQHEPNPERRLVDGLLAQSDCFVALDGQEVVGMVTISDKRPFSLDRKLPDLDTYLPPFERPCEMRLLAVKPSYRKGQVFLGLMRLVDDYCAEHGYDVMVASATDRQWSMYRRAGAVEFGPMLGTPDARFRGVYLTRELIAESMNRLLRFGRRTDGMAAS
jgi:hypothetical protein